jgi:hypothetical protein
MERVTMLEVETKDKPTMTPTLTWREWAKARAENAPPLERVHEISKKVTINVTQLLLEERRGE